MLKLSVIFEKSYGKNERIYYFRKINYYLCKLILNQNKKLRNIQSYTYENDDLAPVLTIFQKINEGS